MYVRSKQSSTYHAAPKGDEDDEEDDVSTSSVLERITWRFILLENNNKTHSLAHDEWN